MYANVDSVLSLIQTRVMSTYVCICLFVCLFVCLFILEFISNLVSYTHKFIDYSFFFSFQKWTLF